jgi:hypothetical protein
MIERAGEEADLDPSSGEDWSRDRGPESVGGHPASTTTSSDVMYVTNFGLDWRAVRAAQP